MSQQNGLGGANGDLHQIEGSLSQNKEMLDEVQSQVRQKKMQLMREAAMPAEAKRGLGLAQRKSAEAKFRYPPENIRRLPNFGLQPHFTPAMSLTELLRLESQLTLGLKNAIMMLQSFKRFPFHSAQHDAQEEEAQYQRQIINSISQMSQIQLLIEEKKAEEELMARLDM